MLSSKKTYVYNLVCKFFPETRCFELKASLLRWCGAEIGQNVRVCSSAIISGIGELKIGDNSWIGSSVFITSGSCISIGRCVDIAPLVYIGTGAHEIDPEGEHVAGKGLNLDVAIGDGVWLGVRSTILPGVSVGRCSVVAAGAVVTRDVPELSLVAGVPAVVKGTI